ncbi:protein of unknown function DUF4168 [Nannochloropsis gaditana]|uniref:DUF4168 domain-containing protein n=1 Tax=Nannochloropsis gaditana TaxID=72520 RepID=W7TRM5_9STRA|nr:protein of unknown function DUF4168 [Nannochloropsis gaditana]
MTNKGSSPNSFFPAGRLPLPSVLVFVLFLLSSLFSVQDVRATPSNKVKFVSLLANDAVLDRYAAAVAATEPLREDRDRALRDNINPLHLWWVKTTKKNVLEAHKSGPRAEAIRRACTYHVTQSSRIIKSLGLSVADFNLITRRLAHDAVLRKKASRRPKKWSGEGEEEKSRMARRRRWWGGRGRQGGEEEGEEEQELPVPTNVLPHRLALFAKSLREIEALRAEQNHLLKQEFHVDALPPGATDPSLFPILNTKVQHLCLRFPVQAEEIAQKNGFETAEFNSLLLKTEKNPFFRWRRQACWGQGGCSIGPARKGIATTGERECLSLFFLIKGEAGTRRNGNLCMLYHLPAIECLSSPTLRKNSATEYTKKSAMLGVPSSIAGMAKGVAVNGKRGVSAIKPTLQTSSPSLVQRQHRRIRPLWQHQLRQLATETTHATPVPPPPPSHRNRVYPAVLLVTFAAVVYVIMTPDDEDIDSKILQAVQARLPAEVPPEELSTAETSKER